MVGRKAKKARPGSGGRRHNCECDGANLLINNSNRRERKTTAARKEREKENSRAEWKCSAMLCALVQDCRGLLHKTQLNMKCALLKHSTVPPLTTLSNDPINWQLINLFYYYYFPFLLSAVGYVPLLTTKEDEWMNGGKKLEQKQDREGRREDLNRELLSVSMTMQLPPTTKWKLYNWTTTAT